MLKDIVVTLYAVSLKLYLSYCVTVCTTEYQFYQFSKTFPHY